MKKLLCIPLFLFCSIVSAQSPTENYVKTTTYTAPSTGTITENDTIVSVTYYDGLGRPKQVVNMRAGGGGQDIVTPVVYDQYGRQTREYLPYATVTQNGNIQPDPMTEVEAFYNTDKYGNTTNPYSEKLLENSPLNRVHKQGAPGNPWAANPASDTDHSIKFSYDANTADEVRLYRVNLAPAYVPSLEDAGFYLGGRLYKTITKDENWQPGDGSLHTTEEFKDLRGRVVLKRTYADLPGQPQAPHDTYYVYDRYSNLTYVIPPKVNTSDGVSSEELNELCYQYMYDHRNRLVEKKLPGKGWEYIVYNKLDLPVFTQDQNLADNDQWLFTKYDKFNRPIYTGIFSATDSREALQNTMNGITAMYDTKTNNPTVIDGTDVYYDNTAFPTTDIELLTITYYDNYTFDLDGAAIEDSYSISPITMVMSLAAGSKTRVLETDKWITSVVYYDKKGRPIYTYTKNSYLSTTDKIKHKLDFVGKVLETTSVHTKDGLAAITTIEKFTYDRMGRLLKHTHQLAGQPEETLVENMYDELGQLVQKKVGNTPETPLQTIDYSYNIRGWLTKINDVDNIGNDLFSFDIRYNEPTPGGTALYNGNISQTHWKTNNTDSSLKYYNYSYDALNRITGAIHNTGNYNLNAISYDKNGNILALNRQGHINEAVDLFGVMDDLSYMYDNGNKLLRVEDTANDTYGFKDDAVAMTDDTDDYTYDDNGNMISDTNKGITAIVYNHLNLPTQITINGENIFYIYDASGIKQQKVADGTTTQYAGSYSYENGSLKFISHTEGYIEPDGGGGYNYVYQYKDHWGNTRVTYSDDNGDGVVDINEIRREQNYYPFGLEHRGYNGITSGVKNNLKTYQGQEFTEDLELNTHEWKYRMSDPAIGRFWQIDPLAEDYTYNSTYAFQENKMGMGVELEGLEMTTFQDRDGNNVVNVHYKVVNSTTGDNRLSQEEVTERAQAIGDQFKDSFEGKDADGSNTIVNVSYEYVDSASTENGDFFIDFVDQVTTENYDQLSESGKMRVDMASGKVDEVGNTQTNRIQVVGKDRNSTTRESSITGAHETGHAGGSGHANVPSENTDAVNQGIQNSEFGSRGNLMKTGAVGTNIVPAQRTHLINTIKKQQKKQ